MSTWDSDAEFERWLRWKKETNKAEDARLQLQSQRRRAYYKEQSKQCAVRKWLAVVRHDFISLYFDIFIKNNFSSLEQCAKLTKESLDNMNVLMMHRERILRNLPKKN